MKEVGCVLRSQVMTRVKPNEVVDDAVLLARAQVSRCCCVFEYTAYSSNHLQKEINRLQQLLSSSADDRYSAPLGIQVAECVDPGGLCCRVLRLEEEVKVLKAENQRLRDLLTATGIGIQPMKAMSILRYGM